MNAATIVGYTGDARVYCVDCANKTYTPETDWLAWGTDRQAGNLATDTWPAINEREGNEVTPIFADSETDTQQYCCQCHELIDNKYIMWAIPSRLAREVGIEPTDTLPSFAWPGGYQIIYFDVHMDVMCPDCANSYDERPNVDSASLYQEGPAIQCDVCGKMIESDYGDPNEEEITD